MSKEVINSLSAFAALNGALNECSQANMKERIEKILWVFQNNYFSYIQGYKVAADILIDRDEVESHSLVIPASYLYRHYMELEMKGMLHMLSSFSVPVGSKKLRIHDVEKLWVSLKDKLIECSQELGYDCIEYNPKSPLMKHEFKSIQDIFCFDARIPMKKISFSDENAWKHLDEIVGYIHSADPKSQTWRYPSDKNSSELLEVNINDLKEKIDEISSFFKIGWITVEMINGWIP